MGFAARLRERARWLIVLAAACSSRREPSESSPDGGATLDGECSVAEHVEVPLDLFEDSGDPPSLAPFGARFALVDSESVTLDKTANVAIVSWNGVDEAHEFMLSELCPDGVCRNIHGLGALGTASGAVEFLLAEQGSAESMPAYPLRAMAWDSDASAAAITPLFDSRVTAITTRADLQSSRDATRALFVLGNIDMNTLGYAEIAPGATLVAPPASMTLPSTPWDCASVVPTDGAGAISAVSASEDGTSVTWSLRELDAGANVVFETSATVPVGQALGYTDCPTLVESPLGFHAQWVSAGGSAVIASVTRDAEPGAAPELFELDANPGSLSGMLRDEFVFLSALDAEHEELVRLTSDGYPAGPAVSLPGLTESTAAQRRAPPKVLRVDGDSIAVSYELESTRVFEELSCP
ncbi:MAG TPA: hypothetical protein VMI54_06930 [Polyangiaceae bacterium]|nr:hypothetical protein [Polyangiaceae bacterium]